MVGCCKTATVGKERQRCPRCGNVCLPVSQQTMLHHVGFPENANLPDEGFCYCSQPHCEIAYFSPQTLIEKSALHVFMQQQEPLLCYCFGIAKATYATALQQGASASIKSFVVEETKAKNCACAVRNPSGRCCLADFKALEDGNGKE